MAKLKYNTSLRSIEKAHEHPGEFNDGPRLVEPGESLPVSLLIERMMDAGVRKQVETAMIRMFHFGPNEEIPEEFFDPTQKFDFNWAEAHAYKRYLEAKIRMKEEEAEAIKKEVAEREVAKAALPPDNVEDSPVDSG